MPIAYPQRFLQMLYLNRLTWSIDEDASSSSLPLMLLQTINPVDGSPANVLPAYHELPIEFPHGPAQNLQQMLYAWDQLHVGGVIINDIPSFRVDNMPYGGVKDSGLGREGIQSAIRDMQEERLLVIHQPGWRLGVHQQQAWCILIYRSCNLVKYSIWRKRCG